MGQDRVGGSLQAMGADGADAQGRAGRGAPTPSSTRRSSRTPEQVPTAARSEVLLVGRVAAQPQERELPSGDTIVTWRLVVNRPAPTKAALRVGEGLRPSVDTFDCAAWTAGVRRSALRLLPGDVVAVEGALRRRFWRGPAGPSSRYEVEVSGLKRQARPS